MIPGSPSPISTPRGGHQPLRAPSPAIGARRPTSVAQPTAPSEGTRSATPSSSRAKSPGASQRGGVSGEATNTALASGIKSKNESHIGKSAKQFSNIVAVQEYIPTKDTRRSNMPIQMTETQVMSIGWKTSLTDQQVQDVFTNLNQHLQKNGGKFDRKQFESDIGSFKLTDKMAAVEMIMDEVLGLSTAIEQPGAGGRITPVSSEPSPAPVQNTPHSQPKKDSSIIEAECFLEDQSVWGGGFQPGEYDVIQADSGGSGVCHTYSLGMATAPKSPDDITRNAGQKTIAVCFQNGEVAHTAFKAGDRWNQLLKDNTTGKTHEFSTKEAALDRLYPVVLIHEPGQSISKAAWADAIRKSKTASK